MSKKLPGQLLIMQTVLCSYIIGQFTFLTNIGHLNGNSSLSGRIEKLKQIKCIYYSLEYLEIISFETVSETHTFNVERRAEPWSPISMSCSMTAERPGSWSRMWCQYKLLVGFILIGAYPMVWGTMSKHESMMVVLLHPEHLSLFPFTLTLLMNFQ